MNGKQMRLSLRTRRAIAGYLFIAPLIAGVLLFFLYPFIQSIIFSINKVEVTRAGYQLSFVGLDNYREALFVHPNFVRVFVETLTALANDIPLILIFSFFIASVLNQEFRGRLLARIIFFLPVILTARILYNLQQGDYMQQAMNLVEITNMGGVLTTNALQTFLIDMRIPAGLVQYIVYAIQRLPDVINASAIPILIFLAALQSVPKSVYEVAYIEGATAWEIFWKVTVPLISSFILVNIVYIVIDSFTAPENELIAIMREAAWGGSGYGVSTAMAWIYFLTIFLVLGIVMGVVSRYAYYEN